MEPQQLVSPGMRLSVYMETSYLNPMTGCWDGCRVLPINLILPAEQVPTLKSLSRIGLVEWTQPLPRLCMMTSERGPVA